MFLMAGLAILLACTLVKFGALSATVGFLAIGLKAALIFLFASVATCLVLWLKRKTREIPSQNDEKAE